MNKIDKYLSESTELDDAIEDIQMALDDLREMFMSGKGNHKSLYKNIVKELKKMEKYL
jgi:phage shock protein A